MQLKVRKIKIKDDRNGKISSLRPALEKGEYFEITDDSSFSLFSRDDGFGRKPYVLVPRRKDEWYLIVPRFIDLNCGWLYKQTESYNVFIVNRYVEWLSPIPPEIRKELQFPHLPELKLEDQFLITSTDKERDWAWKKYKRFLIRREDHKIRIRPETRFSLVSALIRDGILPFTPQSIARHDLNPSPKKIDLYPFQKKALEEFFKLGAVGIFWPPGAGKTWFSVAAINHLKGPKLVIVPSRTLIEQWKLRLEQLSDSENVDIITYQSADKVYKKEYTLAIFDEAHYLPANTYAKLATIKTKYRIGLSATPFREDGRTYLIFALTGFPMGLEWKYFFKSEIIKKPSVEVKIAKTITAKLRLLRRLAEQVKGKTLIFCDSIPLGQRISSMIDAPFIYGKSSKRLQKIMKEDMLVISRVGDEGLDLEDIRNIIEVDFLFGSRRQELQRLGRLLHSKLDKKKKHIILMTERELDRYSKRLLGLYEKDIQITFDRE